MFPPQEPKHYSLQLVYEDMAKQLKVELEYLLIDYPDPNVLLSMRSTDGRRTHYLSSSSSEGMAACLSEKDLWEVLGGYVDGSIDFGKTLRVLKGCSDLEEYLEELKMAVSDKSKSPRRQDPT